MTRCEEFYLKVEKDGNFCGMSDGEFRRLQQFKEFVKDNPAIASLSQGAARVVISEPDEEVKAKAIEVIAKQLDAGEKVTSKIVKEDLLNAGHEDKVEKERIYTEQDKIKLFEDFVNDMLKHGCTDVEIVNRIKKALTFSEVI